MLCNEKGQIVADGKYPCPGLTALQNNIAKRNADMQTQAVSNLNKTLGIGVDGPTSFTQTKPTNTVDWSEKVKNVSAGLGDLLQGIGALKNQNQNQNPYYGQQYYQQGYDPNLMNNQYYQTQNKTSPVIFIAGALVLGLVVYLLFFNK